MRVPQRMIPDSRASVSESAGWAVGITTAARKRSTLAQTLQSLVRAGWAEVTVFAEPSADVTTLPNAVSVSKRANAVGAFGNWYLGLAELYQANPSASAYLITQDDAVFCRRVRHYIESRRAGSRLPFCGAAG